MPSTSSGAGRIWRRIAISLILLIIVAVAADRVGNHIAEDTAGSTIQTSQKLRSQPRVDIAGFPFLTQLAAGDFDQVTVTATNVPVGGDGVSVTFREIRVVLDRVTVTRDFSRVHARTADAVATVGYGALSQALGVDVSYAGNGRIKASKKISVLGQSFTPTITAAPILTGGALSFAAAEINGAGALGGQVSQVLHEVFGVPLPLGGIPFDIKIQKLQVDASGLVVRLAGADLTYTKGN
ncbi:MAG: LmeA family phospholipid-binding protein [Jatrophihabitans sp.]